MRSAFMSIDVIDVAEKIFVVAVVIFEADLDRSFILIAFDKYRLMQRDLIAVSMLDEIA